MEKIDTELNLHDDILKFGKILKNQDFSEILSFSTDTFLNFASFISLESSISSNHSLIQNVFAFLKEKDLLSLSFMSCLSFETIDTFNVNKSLTDKYVKYRTIQKYKQNMFNLCREESEGYSKLIMRVLSGMIDREKIYGGKSFDFITSIIGYFNLCPNRSLDIILDLFITNVSYYQYFLEILILFKNLNFHILIGNKLEQDLQLDSYSTNHSSDIFLVAALLIKNDFMTLQQIFPFVDDSVALSANLVDALFMTGNLKDGMDLLSGFDDLCSSREEIVNSFCSLLHYLIHPVYLQCRPSLFECIKVLPPLVNCNGFLNENLIFPAKTVQDIYEILPYFHYIGHKIHKDLFLLQKLVRISATVFKNNEIVWKNFYKDFIFPAISLNNNIGFVNEVWNVIKSLPYETRYQMYGNWMLFDSPDLHESQRNTVINTKKALRRISKENVKPLGRLLGKISLSNPIVCFNTVLQQLMVYDSIILPIVDCFKYLSELSFDVLCFTLISFFCDSKKKRVKDDGTNLSTWIVSLSSFAGSLFRRHPYVEIAGLFHCIIKQVKNGNPFDLVILKELLTKMSGIGQIEDFQSDYQIQAAGGGSLLKQECAMQGKLSSSKKSTERLMKALADSNLASAFAFVIAEQRDSIIFNSDSTHLKLIGSLYDQIQETFIQYVDFLVMNASNYESLIPPLENLLTEFQMSAETAWFLSRHKINLSISYFNWSSAEETLPPYLLHLTENLPIDFSDMCRYFYISFWSLSLYDIFIPTAVYDSEIIRNNSENEPKLKSTSEKLKKELLKQQKHHQTILKRLHVEKRLWFSNTAFNPVSVIQRCFLPRILFSAVDSLYCSRFLQTLFHLELAEFSLFDLMDCVFDYISTIIFSCTYNEISNFGRFLKQMFDFLDPLKNEALCDETKIIYQGENCTIENVRLLLFQWHEMLCSTFLTCLSSREYMKTKNSIVVLDKMTGYFPKMEKHGQHLSSLANQLVENETRNDLKVMLNRLVASLQKGSGGWISEENFKSGIITKEETKQDISFEIKPSIPEKQSPLQMKIDTVISHDDSGREPEIYRPSKFLIKSFNEEAIHSEEAPKIVVSGGLISDADILNMIKNSTSWGSADPHQTSDRQTTVSSSLKQIPSDSSMLNVGSWGNPDTNNKSMDASSNDGAGFNGLVETTRHLMKRHSFESARFLDQDRNNNNDYHTRSRTDGSSYSRDSPRLSRHHDNQKPLESLRDSRKDYDAKRDRGRDYDRERDRDRDRDSRDRDRDRGNDRGRDRSGGRLRDRDRDNELNRSNERNHDRGRDNDRNRSNERNHDRGRDNDRNRSNELNHDRGRDNDRNRSNERNHDRSRDNDRNRSNDRNCDREKDNFRDSKRLRRI